MQLAFPDVKVYSHIICSYKVLCSGCFHKSCRSQASHISKLKVRSKKLHTIGMHMQFNSGGLEALLEANGVAMEPSGAVLLTG